MDDLLLGLAKLVCIFVLALGLVCLWASLLAWLCRRHNRRLLRRERAVRAAQDGAARTLAQPELRLDETLRSWESGETSTHEDGGLWPPSRN